MAKTTPKQDVPQVQTPTGTEPAPEASTGNTPGVLAPTGTELVPTTYAASATIPTHDSGLPTREQVTAAFDGLEPAEGNVKVLNLITGNVSELNEADARRLVAETPKDYQLI